MKSLIPLLVLPLVAGCSLEGDYTDSAFTSSSAVQSASYNNEQNGSLTGTQGSVYYVTGTDDNGAHARVGFDVGAIGTEPSGMLWYTTMYDMRGIENIRVSGELLSGNNMQDGGAVVLIFDSADGSLAGNGTSNGGASFAIDATVSGNAISGSAVYEGKTLALDGAIGIDGLIGGFHGQSDTYVYAGGMRSISVAD